ncbi:MAG: valine--tRNA ligase, partial [Bdellovibrionales bacterium]|nr:valine--tRNA ligase [Bdellovibrionales bacterium]
YGGRILDQMKRLGDAVDWDRLTFTLDEGVSKAVKKVFVHLYQKNLIYRGTRLINWSPALESALSDLEVEFQEVKGNLWHIRYPVEGGGQLVVATTRPETMLGDTAVAVHPEDPRYKSLIGKKVLLPLTNRKIPIIADAYVEKDFGSGVVKITPAHDFNDYEVGLRHNLPMLNILNKDGTLNSEAGSYAGLTVKDARKKVIADLEEKDLLEKTVPHVHQVGHCSRTGCVVEPFLSDQWFVRTKALAEPAKRVVESGTITFEPELWTKTYLHWMNNIQDWCISRQLWWGHRIPAWHCNSCSEILVVEEAPTQCAKCSSKDLHQDEDVLDTWFSSGLWPFSTLGWPKETEALKTFYPTNVLVTGHDIIFFWVSRMIMMGLEFQKDVPFRTVYIHGLIRDAQGKKMSKSSGNTEDPLELIEQFGADALRFTLLASLNAGRDLKFSKQRLEGYRNFMNKIWNAARFSLKALEGHKSDGLPNRNKLTPQDEWIVYKLGVCEKEVDEALQNYRFSDAAQSVYSFFWHEFCDWYLEFIKPVIYGEASEEKSASLEVLAQTLKRAVCLLHPFAPFISEALYQKLPGAKESIMVETFPTARTDKDLLSLGQESSAYEMDMVRDVITAARNIRGENRIKPGVKIKLMLQPSDGEAQKILGENRNSIVVMAGVEDLEIGEIADMSKCAVTPVVIKDSRIDVVVPLQGLVDFDEEIKRIQKNIEKIRKELSSLTKRLSNEEFLKNAPDEVVEQGKTQVVDLKSQLEALEASLLRLS